MHIVYTTLTLFHLTDIHTPSLYSILHNAYKFVPLWLWNCWLRAIPLQRLQYLAVVQCILILQPPVSV